jgi:hypothetical protein
MKKLISTMIVMGLLLAVGQVFAKGGGSGGSGKGGFGELGDGCVKFVSPAGANVSDDGDGRYCNGSDGQVSVPVHLRFDTKKFNKGHRWFWVEGTCTDSDFSLDAEASAQCELLSYGYDGLMTNVTVVDEYGEDLNWTDMGQGDVLDARMGIKIDNSHFLFFGPLNCPERDPDPVYVRCEADTEPKDGLCDRWTISTDPLFPTTGGTFTDASSACFKSGAYGTFYSEVGMNFTMEVCVIGVSCD